MKVLVTGHRGYIGSVMCKVLAEHGHTVIGVDTVSGVPLKYTSVEHACNFARVREVQSFSSIDSIFHFAASADVGLSMVAPEVFYQNNIGNTSDFVNELINDEHWIGNFIFSSTAAVYKEKDRHVHEYDTIGSPNAYGRSKYACEQLLDDVNVAHKLNVVKFRYFNVAGAYQELGDHGHSGHIIQRLIHSHATKTPFTLFGNKKKTRDGTCIRDYVHVIDVCRAHLHAVEHLKKHPGGNFTFNIGSGRGYSNLEVINAYGDVTGTPITYQVGDDRTGDPDFLVADPFKFINETGFVYNHKELDEMICSAVRHAGLK